MDKIADAYAPFRENNLKTQAAFIRWYFSRNHILQAMTLALEWVVSYYLQQEGRDWQDKEARGQMEIELGRALESVPLWSKIITVRNDLAHCGIGRPEGQVLDVQSICDNAEAIIKEIEQLASELT